MRVSAPPSLPTDIQHSVQNIMNDIYSTEFAEQNVDLHIDIAGHLNYTTGVKLRVTYAEQFEDEDIEEWKRIAYHHGAKYVKTKINTSSGYIDINIEYKSRSAPPQATHIWWIRCLLLGLFSASYHQLHLLQPERYPYPRLL